jgi:putative hemolysin
LKLEGAIILGIGGDNSCSAKGTFFEGAMVAGQPSDATENSVQANLVATYGSGGTTPTNTPPPGTFPVAGTAYRLINRNSGKVADVENCGTADSVNIRQWTSLGNTCQQWTFVATGSYYKIKNVNSGKVMDVSGSSTADGANVAQYTDNGGANQQWTVTSVGSGYYTLTNRNSGKVLDVLNCGTTDGINIQQWSSLSNSCQQWQIIP